MKRILSVLLIIMLLLTVSSCKKAVKPAGDHESNSKTTENKNEISKSKNNKNTKAVAAVADPEYPKSIAFNDYDTRRNIRGNNPLSDEFIASLKKFSYNSASLILSQTDGNANYSPLSLYFALALAGSGAEGTTKDEFLKLFDMTSIGELINQSGNLYRCLYTDNEISKLKMANSLWLDKSTAFKDAYIKNAVENFYSSLFNVDFKDASVKSAMSKWISENTNGKIVPEIELSGEQIMSLINTVYFYDEWVDRFDESKTAADKFYPSSGDDVTCDYMNATFPSHGYYDGDGFTRSSLSLKNAGRMVFILPDEGTGINDLLSDKDNLSDIFETEDNGYGKVIFKIPKFSFDCTYDLKDVIKALGVKTAFTKEADFSNITDGIAYISGIKQQTHIAINETGVEAAAFTQIDYAGSAMPSGRADMILNRPFIYGIIGNNDTLLFIGVCENPKETKGAKASFEYRTDNQNKNSDNKTENKNEAAHTVNANENTGNKETEVTHLSGADMSRFKLLKDNYLKCDFTVEYTFHVTGKYDLNQDGKQDRIELLLSGNGLNSSNVSTYIKVNGIKKEFYMDYSLDGEVRIFDLDKSDKYYEIAYFDEGPSGDPHYDFYRYDGTDLFELGEIDSYASMDEYGKVISGFMICPFAPAFCSAWYEIENNSFVLKNNDISEFLGKEYDFAGGDAFFIPFDEMPQDPDIRWEGSRQFNPCKIKLKEVYFYPDDRTLNFYYVELPGGEKGLLYFWIGD